MTARPGPSEVQQRIRQAKIAMIAAGFQATLKRHGLPAAVPEHRIIPGRKFAWDWAWPAPEHRLTLEVQGSIWTKGAHARGWGIQRDMTKNNLAVAAGWRCLYVTPQQLCSAETMTLLDQVLRGTR